MSDQRFPTQEELKLISNDIVITKLKYTDENIQPSYHKWRDIWDEGLLFTGKGLNQDYKFRAVAITLPMYFLDGYREKELNFRGYVAGLLQSDKDKSGDIQIFPIKEIKWV